MRSLLLFLFLFSAQVGLSQSIFTSVLDDFARDQDFSGVVLVATDGKVDLLRAIGLADRDQALPMRTDSKFRIASMSKVFTSVLVMKLVEAGKLDLDKPMGVYLPEYTGAGKDQVTLHHLLTYSSGIENTADPLGMKSYQTLLTLDEYIARYCSGPLVFVPGSESRYGNTEFILLQKIIEKVSGRSFEENLADHILRPLQLRNTGMYEGKNPPKDEVTSYTWEDSLKTLTRDEPYLPEMYFGAGGMYSTAEDLLAFDQGLFGEKLLSPESTSRLLTIHPELGYTAYGFWGTEGWGTFAEKFYYRTGGILGASSNWIHTMDSKKTILILSNTNRANLFEISEALYLLGTKEKTITGSEIAD
jgi:CubicO group peptidase (beta-lactamase class C family)